VNDGVDVIDGIGGIGGIGVIDGVDERVRGRVRGKWVRGTEGRREG
jgi:hypothetical protein